MKNRILTCVLITVYLLIASFSYKEYRHYDALVREDINEVFDEAVKKEDLIRQESNQGNRKFQTIIVPDSLIPGKGIQLGTSPSKIISYSEELQKETPDKNIKRMTEYFLAKYIPVNKENLDSLFKKGLQERKIAGLSQVTVSVEDSGNSEPQKHPVLNRSTFYTPISTHGIKPIIKLQGQIDYSKWSVLRRMDTAWMAWGGVLLLSLVLFVVKRKSQEVQFVNIEMLNPVPLALPLPAHPEPEYKWSQREDGIFYMEEEIYFNSEDGIVYDKRSQKKVKLTPQLSNLFVLFLMAEEHRVPVKDIVTALWPEDENWEQDTKKVSQRINKLKEGLLEVLDVEFIKPKSAYILRSWPKKERILRDDDPIVPQRTHMC